MTNIPDAPPVSFIDTAHAPDVFADALTGFFLMNGNLRMTLEAYRVNHISNPGPVNRVVIGRLVMPVSAAEQMARSVLEFIERMRTQSAQTAQSTPTLQ